MVASSSGFVSPSTAGTEINPRTGPAACGIRRGLVSASHSRWRWRWLTQRLKDTFLPIGYPDSVGEDYLDYQFWDTLQDLSSQFNAALAKATFFKALVEAGGGDMAGTSMSIAVIVLIRQLCQKLGPLCFGWFKVASIDSNARKWRFVADCTFDFVLLLEVCMPLLPAGCVIPAACISSAIEGVSGVLGSATKTALLVHHARCNNAADVALKEQYQLFCAKIICIGLACTALPVLTSSPSAVFATYFSCAAVHLLSNVRAQRVLRLTSLNEARLLHCLREFLEGRPLPSVREVNRSESIFFGLGIQASDVCGMEIRVGADFDCNGDGLTVKDFDGAKFELEGKPFCIRICSETKQHRQVDVFLRKDICHHPRQLFEAYVRAVLTAFHLTRECEDRRSRCLEDEDLQITAQVNEFSAQAIRAGFDIDKVSFAMGSSRYSTEKLE